MDYHKDTIIEKNTIISSEKVFGSIYKHFKFESGLYIPLQYTEENRQNLLRDYGLASGLSTQVLFGKIFNIEEIKNLISVYKQRDIFNRVTLLSRHFDLHEKKLLQDPIQLDIVRSAIQKANGMHLKIKLLKMSEFEHVSCLSYQTFHAIFALMGSIGLGFEGKINFLDDPGNLCLAFLAINDHVMGPNNKLENTHSDFHYENLRDTWLKGPLAGSGSEFARRVHRLVQVTDQTICKDKTRKLENYFQKHFGFTLKEFHSLIPVINTTWFIHDKKDNELSILNCTPLDKPAHVILNKYLAQISFDPNQYTESIRKIENEMGAQFLVHNKLLHLFIRKPFLQIEEGKYLLLAPHLLLRNMELALTDSFFSQKQSNTSPKLKVNLAGDKVTDLYSPLGAAVEDYVRELIEKCVKKCRGINEIEGVFTDSKKQEIGDYIILHPEVTILFEIKNKQPNFTEAFDPSLKGLEVFKRWFRETYLRSSEEAKQTTKRTTPGALHQLERDCKKLFNGAITGFKPVRILPVIVNPQDLIFHFDFFSIIDCSIREQGLFQDSRILSPLVLGIGDLEYIYGLNLQEKGMSLRQVLLEKVCDPARKLSTWNHVLKQLGFSFAMPKEFSQTFSVLIKRAIKFLHKKSSIEVENNP